MEDMKIAELHTLTKSLYDRGQRLVLQSEALTEQHQTAGTDAARANVLAAARVLVNDSRQLHREAINLKTEVQGHENWYPTAAIYNFRLWRVMDAVSFALQTEAAANRLNGDAAVADLLDKQSADALAEANLYHDRARQAEQELGKVRRK